MGKFDYWAKKVFSSDRVFADTFNGLLFGGNDRIKPKSLRTLPTTGLAKGRKGAKGLLRERDLIKRMAFKTDGVSNFMLLGIEAQSYISPALPAKMMLYDAILYNEQIDAIKAKHRKEGNLTSEFFLSGLSPDDRLLPVITMVLDLSGSLEAPLRNLHGILDIGDENLRNYIPDYSINVVSPVHMERDEIMRYGRDAATIMLSAKYASDLEAFQRECETNELFGSVNYDTACLVNVITGMDKRIKKTEKVNMAMDRLSFSEYYLQKGEKIGQARGEIIGIVTTMNSLGKTREETCAMLMTQCSMDDKDAFKEIDRIEGLKWPAKPSRNKRTRKTDTTSV